MALSWPVSPGEGRRDITPIAYGPSIGKNIALGYLPKACAEEGRTLTMEYFAEYYPIKVEAEDYRALFDPENERMRSSKSDPFIGGQ